MLCRMRVGGAIRHETRAHYEAPEGADDGFFGLLAR